MPRAGPKKVRRYSLEFTLKAVKLSELKGVEVQAVADALELHPFMPTVPVAQRSSRRARRRQDRALLEEMRAIFEDSGGTYGSPRIQESLAGVDIASVVGAWSG